MKRVLSVLLASAVFATLVAAALKSNRIVRPAYADSGCSVATLNSSYGFSESGFALVSGSQVPFAAVGLLEFDGRGNSSITYTFAFGGTISTSQTGTGTYSVNTNCTGSVSFTTGNAAGITDNIAIARGAEVLGIQTNSGVTATFDAKKQAD